MSFSLCESFSDADETPSFVTVQCSLLKLFLRSLNKILPRIVKLEQWRVHSPFIYVICLFEKTDRIQNWIVPQMLQSVHRPPKSRCQIEFECRNLNTF